MKPPRQSIRTLIRKAIAARYNMPAEISRGGAVIASGWWRFDDVADWRTIRTDSGNVRLMQRDCVFFTFGPDA